MNRKIIISQGLFSKIPLLRALFSELELELVLVAGDRDTLQQIRSLVPCAALLEAKTPQINGMECARQVRQSQDLSDVKIVLVASDEEKDRKEEYLEAGCDLFVSQREAEQKIAKFLLPFLKTPSEASSAPAKGEEFRPPPERMLSAGSVQYVLDNKLYDGLVKNLNSNGILFATQFEISKGTLITLRLKAPNGYEFVVPGTVVRTVNLSERQEEFSFATGVKFAQVSEEDRSILEEWIASLLPPDKRALPPEFVRRALEADPELIRPLVSENRFDARYQWLGQLTDFEQAAFSLQDAQSDCVRRLVLLRVQCGVFHDFVPVLKADSKNLGGIFLGLLSGLLSRADAIETEVDQYVRDAVATGKETERQNLNLVSNHLHDVKAKMLFQVADKLTPGGLGPHASLLGQVQERVKQLRVLKGVGSEELKYTRKTEPKSPPSIAVSHKRGASRISLKYLIPLVLVFLIVVGKIVSGIVTTIKFATSLDLPIAIKKLEKEEEGIRLQVSRLDWDRLKQDQRDDMFMKIEKYLEKQYLAQMTVVDEKGQMLGAIMSGFMGRKRVYERRFSATK